MTEPRGLDGRTSGRRRRVVKIVAAAAVGLLAVLSVGGVIVYRQLDANIGRIPIADGPDRPAKVGGKNSPLQPRNVLLIGSDTRKGQTGGIGGDTPGLSDTTIVLHLSADRKRAFAVSIPRDTMVHRPECTKSDGSTVSAGLTQFNDAYALGGAQCTLKTVEKLSDVHIDNVVVIKFNGFRKVVDALGGVKICLPEEVNDDIGRIHLDKGTYTAKGETALDYVRVRHGIGDGGDVGRIARQQAFLASLTNKAVSAGTLTNPKRLYSFLDAVTSSISADEDLGNLRSLFTLGRQLRGVGLDDIKFLTVPIEPYAPNRNKLQLRQPAASKLWSSMRNDQPLGSKQSEEATSAATRQKRSQTQRERAAANGLCS